MHTNNTNSNYNIRRLPDGAVPQTHNVLNKLISFCTGRCKDEPSAKRILTDLTRLSSERWTSVTLAIFQEDLGVWSSTKRTTSPTLMLFLMVFHLERDIDNWTISRFHLDQKRSIKNWTLFHWRRAYKSTFTDSGCICGLWITLDFMVNKWFGVRGSSDCGSAEFSTLNGLLLTTAAVSAMMVSNPSSSRRDPCSTSMPSMTRRETPIILSQRPPLWLEAGGVNSISQPIRNNSPLAPTKFVPWSHLNCLTGPLRATNLRNELRKLSVEREYTTSRWTARLTKQVNMTPYLLTSLRPHLTRKGPKRSVPQSKNGGPGDSLSAGKSDIFCSHGLPRRREQTTQEWMRRFTNLCSPRIQKPWLRISAHVSPRPWWWTCWW